MILSGKIAIGFLEEDNPIKAYFRFKPLVLRTEEGYVPLEGVNDAYPEDGYLRIVPDKNESSHFKARMRRIGRFCMIDMRRHQSDADKIRTNKNYRGSGPERNVYIVYSDVVIELDPRAVAEVVSCADAAQVRVHGNHPGSLPFIVAEADGRFTGPWRWVAAEGEDNAYVAARSDAFLPIDGDALPQGQLVQLQPDEERGFTLLIAPEGQSLFEAAPQPEPEPQQAAEPAPEVSAQAEAGAEKVETARPADEAAPEERATDSQTESEPEVAPQPEAQAEPTPDERSAEAPEHRPEGYEKLEAEGRPAPRPARSAEAVRTAPPRDERPYRQERPEGDVYGRPAHPARSESAQPRVSQLRPAMNGARANQRSAALEAQRGLNPKRGASLLEIIDDQWRHSRLDQLGHPVPPEAGAKPMMSPVDRAREALREAWQLTEARGSVLDAVLSLDQLPEMLPERFGAGRPMTQEQVQELDEFEARRLKALHELDQLSNARNDRRRELLDEVKRENAVELRRLQQLNDQARADAEKNRAGADAAAEAAETARKALDKITGEQLLERLMSDELQRRAAAMLRQLDQAEKPTVAPPALLDPTAGELISDLRAAFEDYGMPLNHDQAVNLLASLALFDMCVYSGVTGSGKSRAARLMAQTLGLSDGRFVTLHAGSKPATSEAKFADLNAVPDDFTPLIALIDDANCAPGDPARGLGAMHEDDASGIHPNMKLILTVQDNPMGYPMNANLLDRACFVRFDLPGLELPWKPCAVSPRKPAGAVTMRALRKMFEPKAEISSAVQDRMMTLRRKLADLGVFFSARALSDMHRYITAVQPMMNASPMQVLDWALAQRAIPCVLATAPVAALHELPKLLADMPMCLKLLEQPLAVPEL